MDLWLCLSGGNALGAYQGGFCEVMAETGVAPSLVAGTSIGAVVGALVAGNRPERRAAALREFLDAARVTTPAGRGWLRWLDLGQRRAALARNLLAGHPRLFRPSAPGPWTVLSGLRRADHLYDRAQMRALLGRLVDFEVLNGGGMPFVVAAMDMESGALCAYDTRRMPVTVDHLMAATAVPALFAPERIDGRLMGDAGLRANLPLHLFAGERAGEGTVCLAVDLFPLAAPYPAGFSAVVARAQDLLFGGQSQCMVEGFAARHPEVRLLHVVLGDPADSAATKAFDYAGHILDRRWARGRQSAAEVLGELDEVDGGAAAGPAVPGEAGPGEAGPLVPGHEEG